MKFFLKLFIRISVFIFLDQLHTFSLEFLLKICLEIFELLILGNKGISQHVDLWFLLGDLFFFDFFDVLHGFVDGLNFPVFIFDYLVEFSFLSLEELSSPHFLLSLPDQTLRSELHLGS